MREKLKGLGDVRQYGIWAALVVTVLLFQGLTDGKLLVPNNVASLVQQNAYVFILAIGMVMVIVAGHIDLSVGSVVAAIGGVIGIILTDYKLPWLIAVAAALVMGALIGAWHGFWIARIGIPAFIVTLAGMLIFRGVALVLVGYTRAGFPQGFIDIAGGGTNGIFGSAGNLDVATLIIGGLGIGGLVFFQLRGRRQRLKHNLAVEPMGLFIGKAVVLALVLGFFAWLLANSTKGFPLVLIIVGLLVLVYSFVMGRTIFGRQIYAMGGNLAAAKLSGIDTTKTNFFLFVNMGVLCGITAVVATSRAGAAVAAAGQNYELDAIAACFIGGAAVTGGVGKVSGAIVGALVMGVLNMGLSIKGVDPSWQFIIKGLVVLLAVAFDLVNKRRSGSIA